MIAIQRQESTAIRLAHPDQPMVVQPSDVYFAFADGRLSYDCDECGSTCCRGFGYFVTEGAELEAHLSSRPTLPLFIERSRESPRQYGIANCPPECFFLNHDGRCELHVAGGFAAKPETCRIFPFNTLYRVGHQLVVAPHLELCPLQVVSHGCSSPASRHDVLIEAMASQGIEKRVRRAGTIGRPATDVIDLERRITGLSEEALASADYPAFVRAQRTVQSLSSASGPDSVDYLVSLVHDLPGVASMDASRDEASLSRTMIGFTPALRARLVFRSLEGGSGVPTAIHYDRVPHAMLLTYLFARIANASGTARVTYQTLSRLAVQFDSLIWVLSHADLCLTWRHDMPISIAPLGSRESRLRFARLLKALLPRGGGPSRERLGDLLQEHAPRDPVERLLFLKESAQSMAGRLSTGITIPRLPSRGRVTKAKLALHRWAIANLSEPTLQAAYDRAFPQPGVSKEP